MTSRALVRANSAPHDDDVMWSERFNHVTERFTGKVGVELQNTIFSNYMISENTWVPVMYVTTDGPVWSCERHPDNKRGDVATVQQRRESVNRVGVLSGIRSGPWLMPRDELSVVLAADASSGKRTMVQRY